MEEKSRLEQEPETQNLQILSPNNSVKRSSNGPNSPEFEFWMVRNPSFPQPQLVSADELIVDGCLLPLDLVCHHSEIPNLDPKVDIVDAEPEPEPKLDADPEQSHPGPEPESSAVSSASKRWRDIFKMGEKKASITTTQNTENKEKGKKKDRKSSIVGSSNNNGGVSSAAELNINIWPFSRSRSAGTGGNRSKTGGGPLSRKVSSAPCSRSNSAGESKSRKWPNSPSRGGGIHLGRNSPVWQVRRGGSGLKNTEPVVRNVERAVRKEGVESRKSKSSGGDVGASKSRGLNLNVPMCIGYRQQLSCRRDENILLAGSGSNVNGGDGGESGGGGNNNKLFYLRTLFTKKVY